jgi:RNase P/RNase MRP subunit POP5
MKCKIWKEIFNNLGNEAEAEVTLRLTVSQSVSTSLCRAHCGTCDQILIMSEF